MVVVVLLSSPFLVSFSLVIGRLIKRSYVYANCYIDCNGEK